MIFWYSFTNDSFNYWMMHTFQLLWIFIKLIMKQPIFDSELRRLCSCVWLTFCEHSVNMFYIHTGVSSALNPYIDFLIFCIDMLGFPDGANDKEPSCQWRRHKDMGSIPRSGRSPGGGHGNPLHYSCLENPMDRGVWQATVHRVTKSRTWLKWLSTAQHNTGSFNAKATQTKY